MPSAADPLTLTVQLTRKDFLYYTWVLALKRPVLPFLLYSFALIFLLGVTSVWAGARVFSLAVFVPLVGYLLWVWGAARTLWAGHPALREPRRYRFKARSYVLDVGERRASVAYSDLAQVLTSRRALYLLRRDGSADILPLESVPEGLEAFLAEKLSEVNLEVERSSFL